MNTPEDYILDALEIVSSWGLPDDDLADAANAQAHLMSGYHPDYYYESDQGEHCPSHHL